MKVYGGCAFIQGKQCRVFVAARSLKKASEIMKLNYNYMREYWSETGNAIETKAALEKPGACFFHVGSHFSDEVKEYQP